MKKFTSILMVACVFAAPAVQAADWTGAYVGGLASPSNSGDVFYYNLGVEYDGPWALEGTQYGAFAGYNTQVGTYIVGGEIAYSSGSIFMTNYPADEFTDFIDLKARAGVAFDSALAYGFVGYSIGSWVDGGFGDTMSSSGMNYGAGLDFLVTDQVFVGAEFIFRDLLSDPYPSSSNTTSGVGLQSIAIRAGMKF